MKPFIGIDHGDEAIDLTHIQNLIQMMPDEIHHKNNGDLNDEPSFAIIMRNGVFTVVGQISLRMLNDGLKDIGYAISKI